MPTKQIMAMHLKAQSSHPLRGIAIGDSDKGGHGYVSYEKKKPQLPSKVIGVSVGRSPDVR